MIKLVSSGFIELSHVFTIHECVYCSVFTRYSDIHTCSYYGSLLDYNFGIFKSKALLSLNELQSIINWFSEYGFTQILHVVVWQSDHYARTSSDIFR